MKKFLGLLIALGIVGLSGCGDSEKVIEGEVQNVVMGAESVAAEVSATTAEIQEADAQPATASALDNDGYVFVFQETEVKIDADASEIIAQLGEPLSYFEAPSCAFQGLDKIYTYNGFEMDTYPVEDKDYVSAIIFKDDSVATAEGVGIGDSMEKMEQSYGSDSTKEDGVVVYSRDGMKLCFILKDNEIISVEYRTMVLD